MSGTVERIPKRAATMDRLAAAAVEEIRAQGYDGLTVRNVARRAGVAPATAYIHFSSKDHLVADVFWRLLRDLPPVDEAVRGKRGRQQRVAAAIADVARLVSDEPAVAAAATTAMLANQPDVAQIRRRVAASFHDRFVAALGPEADDKVLDALDLAFFGALVRAGVGEQPYATLGRTMATVAEVLIP